MLKALFKKEFLELNTMYFINPKTGKRRSTKGIIGYILLFTFVFISCAISFVGIGMLFSTFIENGYDWLYFSVMAIPSIFISCFIDMFVANSYIFNAKDNDLLLSMPINPGKILLTRMLGLYVFGLLYFSITFIPAIGVYWYFKGFSIFPIIVFIFDSILVLTISVILGFVIAFITSKVKNKVFTTVLLGVSMIALYYFIYFKMNEVTTSIITNIDQTISTIKGPFVLFYHMGLGCTGNAKSLLVFILIIIASFSLVYYVVSKNFISIATRNNGQIKKVYKEEKLKESSLSIVLFKKEMKRFLSSSALMLNIGLGIVILPGLGILLYMKREPLLPLLELFHELFPEYYRLMPLVVVVFGLFIISLTCYTASAISMEGKNYWIIKSSPIDFKEILNAKIKAQLCLFVPPLIIFSAIVGVALNMVIQDIVYVTVVLIAYENLFASFGLFLNLKNPNLTWSNETAVVKQSGPVTIAIFGSWGVAIFVGVATYFLNKVIEPLYIMTAFLVIFVVLTRIMNRWLYTNGIEIMEEL